MNESDELTNLLVDQDKKVISIYDVYSTTKRKFLLFVLSWVSILLSFSDDIYVPALTMIQQDLQTSKILVNISVSIYFITSGLFSLFWGPLSDKVGRRISLIISLVTFFCFTFVCLVAQSIAVFIVCRALQGASISATVVVSQAAIADIYPEELLGRALGVFLIMPLVGPVVSPVVGGWLSTFALGWRTTMLFLALLALTDLIVVSAFVPETHHYYVVEKYRKANERTSIIEESNILKPHLMYPWKPLRYLLDTTTQPYIIVSVTAFSAMVIAWILQSYKEEAAPYSFKQAIIGLTYVPAGVGMGLGAIIGGYAADKAAEHFTSHKPEGRLVPALIGSTLLPLGIFVYGWTFDRELSIIYPLIGTFLLGFGQAIYLPGIFSYLTTKMPNGSGMAAASIWVANFIPGGIGIAIAVPIINEVGFGIFFSILAIINVVAIGFAGTMVYFKLRKHVT